MKTLLSAFVFFFISFSLMGQDHIQGAWSNETDGNTRVLLFQDGYFTSTMYNKNKFISTWGGPFTVEDQAVKVQVEFNSAAREKAGSQEVIPVSLNDNSLNFNNITFSRVDNSDAPLAGVWKITDRMEEDKLNAIHRTGSRKTLKMLTGNRFQWFAINPETKEFSGTGGGTYTFEQGKYTEKIEFFSRDQSRVGAQLVFDGKLEEGKWHHRGLSSRGDKIYEVWGRGFD